jgi:hypothetical protein
MEPVQEKWIVGGARPERSPALAPFDRALVEKACGGEIAAPKSGVSPNQQACNLGLWQ